MSGEKILNDHKSYFLNDLKMKLLFNIYLLHCLFHKLVHKNEN